MVEVLLPVVQVSTDLCRTTDCDSSSSPCQKILRKLEIGIENVQFTIQSQTGLLLLLRLPGIVEISQSRTKERTD